ncbi:MAG: UDP-N-acetylglucosamine pyrophosphorylase [Clostridia bacterium]|nr:UDP-N-acetylglucosamine pyrophosphorylase [Clostridia bacterium]
MYRLKTVELYDLSHSLAKDLLSECEFPWLALPKIKDYVIKLISSLSDDEYYAPSEDVRISKTAKIAPSATICGPAVIGHGTEIRTGAYIRGSVIVGDSCVVGNSCELKNAILFDSVQVPHFNYVGDSILGYRSHTGAGAITSNVKSDKTPVTISLPDCRVETGLKKFGAMIGDGVEVGCNSVLNPGTVIGRNSNIYPLSSVRGFVPPDSIFKSRENVVIKNK